MLNLWFGSPSQTMDAAVLALASARGARNLAGSGPVEGRDSHRTLLDARYRASVDGAPILALVFAHYGRVPALGSWQRN